MITAKYCHHHVGLLCHKYLCMNDYNRHMVNRIRLPSFLGGPNICHYNVGLRCYKYLCVNDYNRHMLNRTRLPSSLGGPNVCHYNVGLLCYKYLCMNDYNRCIDNRIRLAAPGVAHKLVNTLLHLFFVFLFFKCVCAHTHVYALRIVSTDKMLHIINSFILIISLQKPVPQ